jgi:group I intron endonuclease
MGIIYKITNLINEKMYIGATTRSLKERFKGHRFDANRNKTNMLIHEAMRNFGCENFKCELIEYTDDLEARERFWIKEYNTLAPNGYNTSPGGISHPGEENNFYNKKHSQETIALLSEIMKERSKDPKNLPFLGHHHTEETKRELSESHKGKHHKEETKQLMREINTGERNPFFGEKHTEETIKHLIDIKETKDVIAIDLKNSRFLFFNNINMAVNYIIESGLCRKNSSKRTIRGFIGRSIKYNKTAYGYTWDKGNNNNENQNQIYIKQNR